MVAINYGYGFMGDFRFYLVPMGEYATGEYSLTSRIVELSKSI